MPVATAAGTRPWLSLLAKTRQGRTYEEIYGPNRAAEIKLKLSENAARTMLGKKGFLCPNWKGGRYSPQNDDRVYIYAPEHPKAKIYGGYVPEHILVWEQAHGCRVPNGWDVHHKNGVAEDNRMENLEAKPHNEHNGVVDRIAALENRAAILEAENTALRRQLE